MVALENVMDLCQSLVTNFLIISNLYDLIAKRDGCVRNTLLLSSIIRLFGSF